MSTEITSLKFVDPGADARTALKVYAASKKAKMQDVAAEVIIAGVEAKQQQKAKRNPVA